MSHDTHGQSKENKTIISFKNSFWLVVIIVGLFIGALNFVQAMSAGEGEGKEEGKGKTEMKAGGEQNSEKMEKKAEPAPAAAGEPTSKEPAQLAK